VLGFSLCLPAVFEGGFQSLQLPSGGEIEIVAPVIEPGSIMLIRLVPQPGVRKVLVLFRIPRMNWAQAIRDSRDLR